MRILLLAIVSFTSFSLFAQPDQNPLNTSLITNIALPEGGVNGNDCWGYTDENGLEYAVMGGGSNTYIWSLEDYENPIQRAAIPGTSTIWRDIKVWEDHIYVTADNTQNNMNFDGLLIINMSEAPDVITWEFKSDVFNLGNGNEELGSCHNIYIDEDGYAYLSGCNVGNEGVLILDLADKSNPEFVGAVDTRYSHDVYVRDSILYSSEIFAGIFSMYDIRDRANPVLINSAETSFNFSHNAWLSDDGNYLFTTDELPNAYLDAFDISDPMDIRKIDRYRPLETEGLGVIPHNTHYFDGYLVTSWYTDGFIVLDAHRPDNLIKVAQYDTWQGEDGVASPREGGDGCWGAYPFFESGKMLASDRNSGLYILDVDLRRACYLEGKITDAATGLPIVNTQITILDSSPNSELSNPSGDYKTGQVEEGTFEIEISHPNYEVATAMATLVSGEVTILDVELNQSILNIEVVDLNANGLEDAKIFITSDIGVMSEIAADENGNVSFGLRANENYTIQVAKWGYRGTELSDFFFDGSSETLTITLNEGYEDDFFVDLNWDVNSTASAGLWTRGVPNETSVQTGQNIITVNAGQDADGDIGDLAYITGNAENVSWTDDDIDNGFTMLQSPSMDWTDASSYTVEFDTWYAVVAVNGDPVDDSLFVYIGNGIDEIMIHRETERKSEWSSWSYQIFDEEIAFTENMYIRVRASDEGLGNIIEAGFDNFSAINDIIENTAEIDASWILVASPNPFIESITLESDDQETSQLIITDLLGRVVVNKKFYSTEQIRTNDWNTGMYFIQLRSENRYSAVRKIVKR